MRQWILHNIHRWFIVYAHTDRVCCKCCVNILTALSSGLAFLSNRFMLTEALFNTLFSWENCMSYTHTDSNTAMHLSTTIRYIAIPYLPASSLPGWQCSQPCSWVCSPSPAALTGDRTDQMPAQKLQNKHQSSVCVLYSVCTVQCMYSTGVRLCHHYHMSVVYYHEPDTIRECNKGNWGPKQIL